MDWNPVIVVVAVLALISSVVFFCLSRKEIQKQRDEMRRQGDTARISAQLQYYAQLRSWADQVVDLLSKAAFLSICDPEKMPLPPNDFFTKRGEMMAELSALIDRGRWFLPNYASDEFGQHKPEAFRGFRQKSLDLMVEAHDIIDNLKTQNGDENASKRGAIVKIKRDFVSEIQKVLDPRKTEEELKS